CSSYVDSNVFF
nr:immunoglobulin light chain junction region [Macaca mulatta]